MVQKLWYGTLPGRRVVTAGYRGDKPDRNRTKIIKTANSAAYMYN